MTTIAGAALPAYITNNTTWDIQAGPALPVYIVNELTGDGADGALLIANNLSDLGNAATARTNLGLIAGGGGDIWVEKAGDLMSGTLQVDVPTATSRGLILRSTDDSGVVPIFEARKANNTTVVISMSTELAGTSSTANLLNITGTFHATPSTFQQGVLISVTGTGSHAQALRALQVEIALGYTGSASTAAINVQNLSQSTSVLFVGGNVAVAGTSGATGNTTVGSRVGTYGSALNGSTNFGVYGLSTGSLVASGINVAVFGMARNTHVTSPVEVAGAFVLGTTSLPTFENTALLADNGGSLSAVILARDNGTTVFEVLDGGLVNIRNGTHPGNSTTVAFLTVVGSHQAVPSANSYGVLFNITTAGSAAFIQYGLNVTTNAGYTGSASSVGINATHSVAGTGGNLQTGIGNIGINGVSLATTTGTNIGVSGSGSGGDRSVGVRGIARINKNNATNVGVYGIGLNGGSTPIQVGGFFGLLSADPTFESSALIADNGSTSDPVFLARDNGVRVFEILNGGLVVINDTGADADVRIEGDTDTDLLHTDASTDRVGIGVAAPGSKLDVAGSFQCDSITNDTGLASGVYTPTLTSVANVAASTPYECQYIRVGNTVTVSGKVDVDPTLTATSTQLGISLPIASNLGAAEDCAGTAFSPAIASQGAAVLGDATNNRAQMEWLSGDVTNQAMYFTFTYQVI